MPTPTASSSSSYNPFSLNRAGTTSQKQAPNASAGRAFTGFKTSAALGPLSSSATIGCTSAARPTFSLTRDRSPSQNLDLLAEELQDELELSAEQLDKDAEIFLDQLDEENEKFNTWAEEVAEQLQDELEISAEQMEKESEILLDQVEEEYQ